MRIFITGANGFVGGGIAAALLAAGHRVHGLVRDHHKAALVAARGIRPVIGSLDDFNLLQRQAQEAEAVVNAASSDHLPAVEAILSGLGASGKPFLHTSGSSVIADEALGEPSGRIFHEDTPIEPVPDKTARAALDRLILNAPGIRSLVLCNSLIYGNALGVPAQSVQIPTLVEHARRTGVARYIGRGLNRWSTVHLADVAALYVLALENPTAQGFLYVESGEESLGDIVRAIAARLELGEAQSWPPEEAIATLGRRMAVFSLGSNSRVRATAAARLGWQPRDRSVLDWIARELPASPS